MLQMHKSFNFLATDEIGLFQILQCRVVKALLQKEGYHRFRCNLTEYLFGACIKFDVRFRNSFIQVFWQS